MTPTDNIVGQQFDNRRARIVTQHVPTEQEGLYLKLAASMAATGVKATAPVRKAVKKVVMEPRQGEAVKG